MTALGAQTVYVAAEILEASLKAAPHGQGFIYAAGPGLDERHPTAACARAWMSRGEAITNIAGRDLTGRLQYRITRVHPASGAVPDLPARQGLCDGDAELFDLLVQRTAARLPCPSNSELARLLRLQDRHAASYRLHRLAQLGLIEITNPTPQSRMVRILPQRGTK